MLTSAAKRARSLLLASATRDTCYDTLRPRIEGHRFARAATQACVQADMVEKPTKVAATQFTLSATLDALADEQRGRVREVDDLKPRRLWLGTIASWATSCGSRTMTGSAR